MSSLFDQFVTFVEAQPDERPVDHTDGWSECAVGDFVREVLKVDTDHMMVSWQIARGIGESAMEAVDPINGYTFQQAIGSSIAMKCLGVYSDTYSSVKQLIKLFKEPVDPNCVLGDNTMIATPQEQQ